jgi:hypothetical protein
MKVLNLKLFCDIFVFKEKVLLFSGESFNKSEQLARPEIETWALKNKTFYSRNLQIFVIS